MPVRPSGVATSSTVVPLRVRRIIAIAPDYAAPIAEWLSGSAAAWTEVLAALTPAERATVVGTMRAYEVALEKHASRP